MGKDVSGFESVRGQLSKYAHMSASFDAACDACSVRRFQDFRAAVAVESCKTALAQEGIAGEKAQPGSRLSGTCAPPQHHSALLRWLSGL